MKRNITSSALLLMLSLGKNGVIYSDMEGITTAKQLIERALVFIEPATKGK